MLAVFTLFFLSIGAFGHSTVQLSTDVEATATIPSTASSPHLPSGSSESAAIFTSPTQMSETTAPATTSKKATTSAHLESAAGDHASGSTSTSALATASPAPESKLEQESKALESQSSTASGAGNTDHTEDHHSEQSHSETVATSTSNRPEEVSTTPAKLLIQKASGDASSESSLTSPAPDGPASTEVHSLASESPASGSSDSSQPTVAPEAEIPTTTTTIGTSSEAAVETATFELEGASDAPSSSQEPTTSSTTYSDSVTAGSSANTGGEEAVMTSSPSASQAILSTESPDNTEHTFTFVLPDFYDHEHMNESDVDHHFNNSDWAGFGAGVETEGSNEMFDDACAYLQHRVEYLFKINVSKVAIQQLIKELKIHEIQEEAIPALHKNLTECVTSWEESSDNEPSAMCDLLKRTIVDVCKRVDGCDEDDLMKTVFEHLKNLLTTESLHDAIVMMHACAENTHGGHHTEA